MSSTDSNRALVRRYFALWNDPDLRRLDELDDIIVADVVDHAPEPGAPVGIDGVKEVFVCWRAAFPDFVATVEDEIAEGDTVVTRWTLHGTHTGEFAGIAATGRTITLPAVSINRIADDKIIDDWYFADHLDLMRQLGALPADGSKASDNPAV